MNELQYINRLRLFFESIFLQNAKIHIIFCSGETSIMSMAKNIK